MRKASLAQPTVKVSLGPEFETIAPSVFLTRIEMVYLTIEISNTCLTWRQDGTQRQAIYTRYSWMALGVFTPSPILYESVLGLFSTEEDGE